jgi:hypothetical protein
MTDQALQMFEIQSSFNGWHNQPHVVVPTSGGARMISRIPLSVRRKQARDQHESFLYAVAKPQLSDTERCRQQKFASAPMTVTMPASWPNAAKTICSRSTLQHCQQSASLMALPLCVRHPSSHPTQACHPACLLIFTVSLSPSALFSRFLTANCVPFTGT